MDQQDNFMTKQSPNHHHQDDDDDGDDNEKTNKKHSRTMCPPPESVQELIRGLLIEQHVDVNNDDLDDEDQVLSIFQFGSRVYGTADSESDWDFVVVIRDQSNNVKYVGDTVPVPVPAGGDGQQQCWDVSLYDEKHFIQSLRAHDISSLECLWLPSELVMVNKRDWFTGTNNKGYWTLDRRRLRHAVSKKAQHSWVKAKKKLMVEKDFHPRVARKSLFHSFRMLMFALQIAEHGQIVDYGEAIELNKEIMQDDESVDWDHYQQKFKKRHNALTSRFKRACPK